MPTPNRWLLLSHPDGWSDERFRQFEAHCRVFRAHAESVLANWSDLPLVAGGPAPAYVFFPPERDSNPKIVALPLGGDYLLGSRAILEDGSSWMLSCYFKLDFLMQLREGLREPHLPTSFRPVLRSDRSLPGGTDGK